MRKLPAYLLIAGTALLGACSDDSDSTAAALCDGAEINPERLFLQQLGPDRVIIKWRGNADGGAEAGALCFGTDMTALLEDSRSLATITATGHSEVTLTGLTPDTTYYYSVGGAGTGSATRSFRTAPTTGELPADGNIRVWIIGDAGVGGTDRPESAEVRDGYLNWIEANGGEATDLLLMLGDNAYNQGTDLEHQKAVFDVYPGILSTAAVWPTIGNHEMGTLGVSLSADPDSYAVLGDGASGGPDEAPDSPMPYLNIFTLPTAGESGGLSSGTEQYYSFDYGNLHVVSLDSQLAARDAETRAAMLQWLQDDLMSNTLDWTIVIFHHPPYSKGSHDSDSPLGGIDQPIFDMREQFTPVFDAYGVDLVYSGHSHIYERSYYLTGHTGTSDTFDPAIHTELNDNGMPASGQGDESYTQITRNGTDDKVVYTVAGSSGKISHESATFPHPAHFFGLVEYGSVVVDITGSTLQASFIDRDGTVLDSFSISR